MAPGPENEKGSSDEESLNYEDNTDLESTIEKLRQLLADRSCESESFSSDEQIYSPKIIHIDGENETFKLDYEIQEKDGLHQKLSLVRSLSEANELKLKIDNRADKSSKLKSYVSITFNHFFCKTFHTFFKEKKLLKI